MFRLSICSRILKLSSTAAMGLILGSFMAPSYAQGQSSDSNTLEEVTVTGSRIVRRDYESNSPIVTIDSAELENKSGLNIESYLNQLPSYNPSAAPTIQVGSGSNSDVQITPINSVGIASISLRGFGPNRNLVLIDGKRPVPINPLMVVDINQIPSGMIQRVETITGGASAVYGADAVGGVTNFILRNDFEGLDIDAQYSTTEAGDGEEYRGSAVVGSNIANGRGNITIGMEYYKRKVAYNDNRNFYSKGWKDLNTPGNFIGFTQGINGYNCGVTFVPTAFAFNCPPVAVANELFPNRPAGSNVFNPATNNFIRTYNFNADGTVWVNGSAAGLSNFDPSIIDGVKYTYQNVYDNSITQSDSETQQLKYNLTDGWTSSPQERYSIMLNSHYDITDKLTFFGRGTFSQSKTRTLLAGNNAIFGWEADIPYDPNTDSPVDPALDYTNPATAAAYAADPAAFLAANPNPNFIAHGQPGAQHPVPAELAILLNSRPPALTYCLQGAAGCPFNLFGFDLTQPTTDASLVGTSVPGTGRLAPWIPQWNTDDSFPYRSTENTQTQWQVEGGLRAQLPFKDWTGELYFSHGETSSYNINTGNMSLSRYRALAALPDYGANVNLVGNAQFLVPASGGAPASIGNAASVNFGAARVSCTSGFYDTYFGGEARPSQDCIDAINANLQSRTENKQDIVEVNVQGGLFDLPAGEVRAAAGFQYRRNAATFTPDILQSQVSFVDQVVGVYPTGYLDAHTSVKDFYMEALIPIVKDMPFLQKLELETGARHSDYNVAESTWTYKFLGNAQVNDWLRLRGGYNRATRAPNLGELFLNLQQVFAVGGTNFGDACGWASSAPWGASGGVNVPAGAAGYTAGQPAPLAGGQTTAGAMSTYMICLAQMGDDGTGTTGTALSYYGSTFNSGAAGSAFAWVLQEGTPTLKSEKADTFTAGFIASSPFQNPWLANLTAAVDWWMVDINDAIQLYSLDYANFLCYGAVTATTFAEAQAQAATPACQNVSRSASNGAALTATTAYSNQATIATSGIDFAVNWNAQLSDLGFDLPGGVGISVQATWLDYYKTKQSQQDFDVNIDWKGSLGPTLQGTNPGAYEYRVFTNFTYSLNNWMVNLRWRHLPSVKSADQAQEEAIIKHNTAVAAGAPGYLLSYTPGGTYGPFLETDAYDVLDLAFNWNINETWSLRGGIDNVADFSPAISTGTATGGKGYPAGTDLTAVCGGAPGCVNPTTYSLANPGYGTTNGGYYDTLGRRFFVGIKASF